LVAAILSFILPKKKEVASFSTLGLGKKLVKEKKVTERKKAC
jgi:hypothetical protein